MSKASAILGLFVGLLVFCDAASAGIWPEMGDAQTRSDMEMAIAAGLLDNIATQGPQPWTGMLGKLQDQSDVASQSDIVRGAKARLLATGTADLDLHRPHLATRIDVASDTAVVRGYDGLGRSQAEAQVTYEYLATDTALHLSVGARKSSASDRQTLMLDGSYIAGRFGGIVVYTGFVPHWWGPGWISGMNLSTNARPMPQIGVTRVHSTPSDWLLFSWLGPWQFDGFVGLLDGPRLARNTAYIAMHFAFSPLPGFEVGLARTTEMCGSGHPCQPLTEYFTFSNDNQHINQVNEEASIELRYTNVLFAHPFALYAQFMNEDSNPIIHSGTSRLYGGTVWFPVDRFTGRLTLEYANSIPTTDIFTGPAIHGFAYNNGGYPDGMRYRGQTLGFSLDSDSVLYSVQAAVNDALGRSITLTYHRALVSNPANHWGSIVTTAPVRFNAFELRGAAPVPWDEYRAKLDVALRWQDDQPRPQHGGQVSIEAALRVGI